MSAPIWSKTGAQVNMNPGADGKQRGARMLDEATWKTETEGFIRAVYQHSFGLSPVETAVDLTVSDLHAGATIHGTAASIAITIPAASNLTDDDFTVFIANTIETMAGIRVTSGASEFLDFWVYSGQVATIWRKGTRMIPMKPGRATNIAVGDLKFYANSSTGNNLFDGLAADRAKATLNQSVAQCWHDFDHRGNLPIIECTGDFTEGVSLTNYGQLTGSSTCRIRGYNSTKFTWRPSAVSGGYMFQFGDNSIAILSYIKFDGTGCTGMLVVSGHQTGIIDLNESIEYASCPGGIHLNGDTDCKFNIGANFAISGDFLYHSNTTGGINIQYIGGMTVTVTNAPSFTTYHRMVMSGNNIGYGNGTTWSGAFTAGTSKQWEIIGQSCLNKSGNIIPGLNAGTEIEGGEVF